VVLIHGWPLTSESWGAQVDALAAGGFRPIAYDRRGFGQSDKPADGYDYDTLADDLSVLLETLDLTDVSLVGFSMGGGEVVRYLARHGETRVRDVVLVASVTPYLARTEANPEGVMSDEQSRHARASFLEDRESFFEQLSHRYFAAGRIRGTEDQRQDVLAMCRMADPTAAAACMSAFGSTDFRNDLTAISVPTLIIHGDGDLMAPLEATSLRTRSAIEHSTLVVIANAPHGLNVSHSEQFNEVLLGFLS
jgi:pimeloyl-ACP methyl ester carboxylesterase